MTMGEREMARTASIVGVVPVLDVIVMALAASFLFYGFGNVALCLSLVGMYLLYLRVRRSCDASGWELQPLRLLIPLTTVFQAAYWIWFGLLANVRPETDFDWMLPQIDPNGMGVHLAAYLLRHYFLFLFIDVGFRLARNKGQEASRQMYLDIPMFVVISLVVIVIGNFSNPNFITGGYAIAYVASITNRVFPTIIGLLCLIVLSRTASRPTFVLSVSLLLLSVTAGFLVTLETSMRFAVLQQIMIFIAILVGLIVYRGRSDLRKVLFAIIGGGVVVFFVTTTAKLESFGTQFRMGAIGEIIQFASERSLQRLAPFTNDALVVENGLQAYLFQDPAIAAIRIFKAVPFVYQILSGADYSSELEPEKKLYSSLLDRNAPDTWETSYFIAGASEIDYSYGLVIGGLLLALLGVVQGAAVAWSGAVCGEFAGLNMESQYILYALLGLDSNNLLRMPINIIFGAVLIKMLCRYAQPRVNVGR